MLGNEQRSARPDRHRDAACSQSVQVGPQACLASRPRPAWRPWPPDPGPSDARPHHCAGPSPSGSSGTYKLADHVAEPEKRLPAVAARQFDRANPPGLDALLLRTQRSCGRSRASSPRHGRSRARRLGALNRNRIVGSLPPRSPAAAHQAPRLLRWRRQRCHGDVRRPGSHWRPS